MNLKQLVALREKIGTQARAAKLLDVHVVTVSRWETGAVTIPDDQLSRLRELAKNPPPPDGTLKSGQILRAADINEILKRLDSLETILIDAPRRLATAIRDAMIRVE